MFFASSQFVSLLLLLSVGNPYASGTPNSVDGETFSSTENSPSMSEDNLAPSSNSITYETPLSLSSTTNVTSPSDSITTNVTHSDASIITNVMPSSVSTTATTVASSTIPTTTNVTPSTILTTTNVTPSTILTTTNVTPSSVSSTSTVTSSRDTESLKKECQSLERKASRGDKFFAWSWNRGGISLHISPFRSQVIRKELAMRYTSLCTTPDVGPIPKDILLSKWNKDASNTYPGTKWCSASSIPARAAANRTHEEITATDRCCEAHARGQDYILPWRWHSRSHIFNTRRYILRSCSDDIKLFNCLLNDNSTASYEFGQAFFDALHLPCFAYTYPIVCEERTFRLFLLFASKCAKYAINSRRAKRWQLLLPPSFYEAYTKKWFPGKPVPSPTTAEKSWRLACEKDPSMGCGQIIPNKRAG